MDIKHLDNPNAIKIGVVGIGNAGSQVAMAAAREGHNAIVMNTSIKDLDNAVLGKELSAIRIGDGRGSGKGRENAMALLKMGGNEGIKKIFTDPHFKAVVDDADVVFVCFSTGGGTGSGIGPYMTSMLRKAYNSKLIIAYGILPKLSESVLAQANTLACVNEMSEGEATYMLADLEYYSDASVEMAFENIGKYMARTMNAIRGDYLHMSNAGMVDERDMMTTISQPGYMAVHFADHITENELAHKTLQGHLIDAMKRSPACRAQHDMRLIYNTIIANVPDAFTDELKAGNFAELNGYIGEPKATFNDYHVDPAAFEGSLVSITSGMSLPMDRFAAPRAKVNENKDRYEQKSTFSLAKDMETVAGLSKTGSNDIIMGSSKKSEADLSFLDE